MDFCKFQPKNNLLLQTTEENGQYIQYNEMLYRDSWMLPITTDKLQYQNVEVIEIDETEYHALEEAIATEQDIVIEEPVYEEPPVIPDDETAEPDVTLEYVKEMKVAKLSKECNAIIENGFDVVLSDNNSHHFSMDTESQLNLITLSGMVEKGEQAIPYHADGELCKFYSAEDIVAIIQAGTAHKTYHTTYFNSLRNYVNSLTDIGKIENCYYGMNLYKKYQSEVLKEILAQNETE